MVLTEVICDVGSMCIFLTLVVPGMLGFRMVVAYGNVL